MGGTTNLSNGEINIINLLSNSDSRNAEVINTFVKELFHILDSEGIDEPNYLDATDLITKKLEGKTSGIRRRLTKILNDFRTERSFHQELSQRFPLHYEGEEKVDENPDTVNLDSNIGSNVDSCELSSKDKTNSDEGQQKINSNGLKANSKTKETKNNTELSLKDIRVELLDNDEFSPIHQQTLEIINSVYNRSFIHDYVEGIVNIRLCENEISRRLDGTPIGENKDMELKKLYLGFLENYNNFVISLFKGLEENSFLVGYEEITILNNIIKYYNNLIISLNQKLISLQLKAFKGFGFDKISEGVVIISRRYDLILSKIIKDFSTGACKLISREVNMELFFVETSVRLKKNAIGQYSINFKSSQKIKGNGSGNIKKQQMHQEKNGNYTNAEYDSKKSDDVDISIYTGETVIIDSSMVSKFYDIQYEITQIHRIITEGLSQTNPLELDIEKLFLNFFFRVLFFSHLKIKLNYGLKNGNYRNIKSNLNTVQSSIINISQKLTYIIKYLLENSLITPITKLLNEN